MQPRFVENLSLWRNCSKKLVKEWYQCVWLYFRMLFQSGFSKYCSWYCWRLSGRITHRCEWMKLFLEHKLPVRFNYIFVFLDICWWTFESQFRAVSVTLEFRKSWLEHRASCSKCFNDSSRCRQIVLELQIARIRNLCHVTSLERTCLELNEKCCNWA